MVNVDQMDSTGQTVKNKHNKFWNEINTNKYGTYIIII